VLSELVNSDPAKARESGFPAEQAADIAAEQGNDERFDLLFLPEQLLGVPDVLRQGIKPGEVDCVLSPEFDMGDEDVMCS
jgi:hypothetical protein